MPRRLSASASTRNTLWPTTSSSRLWGPDPAISTTPGNGPAPAGMLRVPDSRTPGAVLAKSTASLR